MNNTYMNSAYFKQSTRAKRRSGALRLKLIEDMRAEERMLDHYIIAYPIADELRSETERKINGLKMVLLGCTVPKAVL
jgi:hypothetical protein